MVLLQNMQTDMKSGTPNIYVQDYPFKTGTQDYAIFPKCRHLKFLINSFDKGR
jgi:hypothetical protein